MFTFILDTRSLILTNRRLVDSLLSFVYTDMRVNVHRNIRDASHKENTLKMDDSAVRPAHVTGTDSKCPIT